jgi:16S rRNA processing protein RimM
MLLVGIVQRPHGLRGEVSVDPTTDFPERFQPGTTLHWRREAEERTLTVETARRHGSRILLRFEGIADPVGARGLAGGELRVEGALATPAPADFYYSHDIEGFSCEDVREGALGKAARLEETAAGPLLAIETLAGREALVPFVRAYVVEVDRVSRRIVLDLPEGLMEIG